MRTESSAVSRVAAAIIVIVVIVVGAGAVLYVELGTSSVTSSSTTSTTSSTTTSGTPVAVTEYFGGATSTVAADILASKGGYFAQNGLDVSFVNLSGNPAAVTALAADKTGYAFVDADIMSLVQYEAANPNGTKLVAIALTSRLNPVAIFYVAGTGISAPQDLAGKTIGVPFGSTSQQMTLAFLKLEHVDTSKITFQNTGFSALNGALLTKKVDAVSEFNRALGSFAIQAPKANETVNAFFLGQYGLAAPLGAILVQQSLLQNHPEVARAIVNATLNAQYYCISSTAHYPTCINDYVSSYPGSDYNQSLREWAVNVDQTIGINATQIAQQNLTPLQLGWFNSTQVENTVTFVKQIFNITAPISPSSLYTNQFVQQP